jgi:hypothetical protein
VITRNRTKLANARSNVLISSEKNAIALDANDDHAGAVDLT